MVKRGRPAKENAKRDGYRLRLDEETRQELNFLSEKYGISIAEILRKGVQIQYNLAKNS